MNRWIATAAMLLIVWPVLAVDGEPGMHDPSTVMQADGKFYVYGTGAGLPAYVSDDGWTWRRAGQVMQAVPGGRPGPEVLAKGGNNTWAPDIIRSGDRYFLYYSAPGHAAEVRDRPAGRQDARSRLARLQMGGRRPRGVVRRRRGLQCD